VQKAKFGLLFFVPRKGTIERTISTLEEGVEKRERERKKGKAEHNHLPIHYQEKGKRASREQEKRGKKKTKSSDVSFPASPEEKGSPTPNSGEGREPGRRKRWKVYNAGPSIAHFEGGREGGKKALQLAGMTASEKKGGKRKKPDWHSAILLLRTGRRKRRSTENIRKKA